VLVPSYRKGTGEGTTVRAHHPTRRVRILSLAERRAGREGDPDYSTLVRPDEWHARALVKHTGPDDVAVVAHTESERSVGAWQCADFEAMFWPMS